MAIVSIILQIILGVMFVFLGISYLAGAKKAMEKFSHLRLPDWFRYVTGLVQLIGAVSMFIGIWNPIFAALGGLLLALTMNVGAALHFRINEPISSSVPAFVIGVLSFIVFLFNLSVVLVEL